MSIGPRVAYLVFILILFGGAAIFLCYRLVAVYSNNRRREAKAAEWDEYRAKHKAIREKYDLTDEWNEATSLPSGYQQEIAELNREYRTMLIDRFGADFFRRHD